MKRRFLILILAALFIFNGCSSKGEQAEANTAEEVAKSYFDFTVSEFVDTLGDEYFTHLTYIATVPLDDGSIVNTYTHGSPSDSSAPMVHYSITYDEQTEKVSHISFFVNKDFETDIPNLVLTHYFIHVGVVSSVIEPDIDTEALMDEIAKGFTEDELNLKAASCDREKFTLFASYNDSYYDASFAPSDKQ